MRTRCRKKEAYALPVGVSPQPVVASAAILEAIEPFQSSFAGGPKNSSCVPMMFSVGTSSCPPRSALASVGVK